MYIRWVIRRHKSAASATTVFHDAYLIESYRDEGGSPRQKTICYLGNLRQIDGSVAHVESELFLIRALQTLHRIAAAERISIDVEAILDELRGYLPAFTPDDAREAFANQVMWFYHWWNQHGSSRPEDEILDIVYDLIGDVREQAR